MKESEYLRMAEQEKHYWWHRGRLEIIDTYLRQVVTSGPIRMLNVGCGTGSTVAMLEKYGDVDNIDISEHAVSLMRRCGHSRVSRTDGVSLPYGDNSFDVVCAFDVLEHIQDDVEALAEWSRVLKSDGAIVLTVPAYQWLWSGHDLALHHFRRYTRKTLRRVALAAGLGTDRTSYAIVFSLPILVSVRLIQNIIKPTAGPVSSYVDVPRSVNWMFTRLLYLEARFHPYLAFPAGSSVVAILRRTEDGIR
ncbi:MAG TPA: methyltransferase domain-containing protein [Streptosporangiaceae bacterium]|nr:methyltransferase domain-containing protein [Streptosporangiaceae bacterium]